jgi:hypothetical protein
LGRRALPGVRVVAGPARERKVESRGVPGVGLCGVGRGRLRGLGEGGVVEGVGGDVKGLGRVGS